MALFTSNKDIIRQITNEVLNNGEHDKIDDYFAPDHVVTRDGEEMRGRDSVRTMLQNWRREDPNLAVTVTDIAEEGDTVYWTAQWTDPKGRLVTSMHRATFNKDHQVENHYLLTDNANQDQRSMQGDRASMPASGEHHMTETETRTGTRM